MLNIEFQEEFCFITLARPKKKNALTREMYKTLSETFDKVAHSQTMKAIVLQAQGDYFCAGHDVNDFIGGGWDKEHPLLDFLKYLTHFPKYLIAIVSGHAVGIGTTLLAHCDFVLARKDVTFHTPFINLGLSAEAGSSQIFERKMGSALARRFLLLGEKISAEECYPSLITHLYDSLEGIIEGAANLFDSIERLPILTMLANKDLMRLRNETIDETIEREIKSFTYLLDHPETQEILRDKFAPPPEIGLETQEKKQDAEDYLGRLTQVVDEVAVENEMNKDNLENNEENHG